MPIMQTPINERFSKPVPSAEFEWWGEYPQERPELLTM